MPAVKDALVWERLGVSGHSNHRNVVTEDTHSNAEVVLNGHEYNDRPSHCRTERPNTRPVRGANRWLEL